LKKLSLNLLLSLTTLTFFPINIQSQSIKAVKIVENIKIDGILDEEVWQTAEYLSEFTQFEPKYGEKSLYITYVRILYDDEMIYFGFDCKDPAPDQITAKITDRDGGVINDDVVVIMLDTFLDNNNGYVFLINPLGTQRDGKIADNGRTADFNWDETWFSACKIYSEGWWAEIAIPFKSLRFDPNKSEWGINTGRHVARSVEFSYSSWPLTSKNRVSQFERLTDISISKLDLKNYTIIPYVQAQFQKTDKPAAELGVNARYNITSNIGIEATLNPDFATIEGDVEQINLTRFELSYPEKRPFFLEGAENYSTRVKQFYSRRIGEIPWGAKLNAKIEEWKINAIVTQSDPSTAGAKVDPGEKALYSVFRVNREFSNGSTLGIIGANRNYNEINSGSVGLVATLFFSDVLGMTSQFIKSYGTANDGTLAYFIRPSYDSQFMHFHVRYSHWGEGLKENMNSTGFIRDDNRKEFDTNVRRTFWVNNYGVESIRPMINYNQYWSQTGVLRSWSLSNELEVSFLKKWKYTLDYSAGFRRFEKDFYNRTFENEIEYDNKEGFSASLAYAVGRSYDSDVEIFEGGVDLAIIEGWNLDYSFEKTWLDPDFEEDNSWIHYIRTSFYFNNDMYLKLFYQTKYNLEDKFRFADFDLSRKTIQLVFVWRFLPPFGSIQFALQDGTTRHTEETSKGTSFYTKFSWVF